MHSILLMSLLVMILVLYAAYFPHRNTTRCFAIITFLICGYFLFSLYIKNNIPHGIEIFCFFIAFVMIILLYIGHKFIHKT